MSFRQFGGLNYAAKHNIVSSNYNTSNNLLVSQNVGLSNSYINFLSDISGNIDIYGNFDVSGNLNVTEQISASGGITGTTGSFNYVEITSVGGSTGTTLNVVGSGYFSGSVTCSTLFQTSDYRIKENVIPLNNTFVVDSLIPVTYKNKLTEKQDMGLIAHEVQEVYPFLVNGEKDGEKIQSVNYTSLIPLLIKEIQQLKKRIKVLEEKSIYKF